MTVLVDVNTLHSVVIGASRSRSRLRIADNGRRTGRNQSLPLKKRSASVLDVVALAQDRIQIVRIVRLACVNVIMIETLMTLRPAQMTWPFRNRRVARATELSERFDSVKLADFIIQIIVGSCMFTGFVIELAIFDFWSDSCVLGSEHDAHQTHQTAEEEPVTRYQKQKNKKNYGC